MSVDEALFGWFARKVRGFTHRESAHERLARVEATPHRARLEVLASAAAGGPIEVALVDRDPGTAGRTVLVPTEVHDLATQAENEELLLLRALVGGAIVGARIIDEATVAERAPSIDARLSSEFASWPARRDALAASLGIDGVALVRLLAGRPRPGTSGPALAASAIDPSALPQDVTTERAARRRPPPEKRRVLEQDRKGENPLTHSFEKVHTAEDYQGGRKQVDGEDELGDHAEALDELELDTVVISNETTRSVYHADLVLSGGDSAHEAGAEGVLAYDEWEAAKRRYLRRHCRLTVEANGEPDRGDRGALLQRIARDERRAIAATRAEFLRLEGELRWHTRQLDGPAVDLDAVIDRATSVRAGHDGGARLYVSKRRRGPSLAMLLLVDASMSTDAYVADRRVLDTERDAAAALALATEGFVELAIASFCSFSHDDCRYTPLKGFAEPVSVGLARLAGVTPRGYTRIGPALRHSIEALVATEAERRVVVLLSDGKPTDADRYEGRHGIGDVRQAVREAKQARVDIFALAADPRSAPILPAMFGERGHAGLASPSSLVRAVAGLVTQLRAR